MKRSSLTLRRASIASNSFLAEVSPHPSRSASLVLARLSRLQREDVGRRLDQAVVVEGLDVLLAETFDVEGVARDEMLEPLDPLRRADQPAGAAPDRILLAGVGIDLARGMAAAGGADGGKDESFRALRPLLLNHAENLRNDVAGALHDDRIADADVLARDLVLVMQGRVLHHDAADGDGIELGDRGQRAGAAHLDVDVAQDRGRLLGGKFVSDGVARRARDEAEPLLEVEPVELVDDAVDIVVEPRAPALDIAIGFKHFLDRVGEPDQRIEREAPGAQHLIGVPLRLGRQARPPRPSHRRRSATAAWR